MRNPLPAWNRTPLNPAQLNSVFMIKLFSLALFGQEMYLSPEMKLLTKLICASIIFSTCLSQAIAQGPSHGSGDFSPTTETSHYSEGKKSPSFFHRPSKATPAKQFAFAEKQKAKGKLRAARGSYNDLVHEWHNSPEAVKAQYQLALILLDQGKYTKSFKAFQYLIDHYAGKFDYNKVLEYQTQIARQIMGDRWGDFLFLPGFEAPERALPLFEQIITNAPNWNKAPGVRLKMGLTYEEVKQYEDAISSYDTVQQYHPFSTEAETALFRKSYCLYVLAKKAPRDEKRCRAALSALSSFLSRYKMSPNKTEAESYLEELNLHLSEMYYSRALFYDNKKHPDAALIAYQDFLKKFPSSKRAQEVFARTKILEKEQADRNKEKNEDITDKFK
jgi:outer membrane protein assembly factor BamD (BamD/ComL family)